MRDDTRDPILDNDASDRDLDAMRPDSPERARLVHLDEVKGEFKVAEDDPDIRGWDVKSSDGVTIGKVEDLIVDTGVMKVRYVEVKIDKDAIGAADDRYALIPVGEARLDNDADDVYLSMNARGVSTLPVYDPESFDRSYETSLRDSFVANRRTESTASGVEGVPVANRLDDSAAITPGELDFYGGESYDENRLLGSRRKHRDDESYLRLAREELDINKRQVSGGEARVRKTVETEHVRESVPLEHEELIIERRPISGDAATRDATIGEDEIRVSLSAEELVVNKRVVPTEEVVIKKRVVRENEVVEADLARETLDVDDRTSRVEGDRQRRPEDRA